jgi:hypothetical protein
MRRRFKSLEMDVEYRRFALDGKGGVSLSIPGFADFRLTMTLEDAETLGDALIACVRGAEKKLDSNPR